MVDVIIIGGGVVGAAVAYELSKYKLKITLLEKNQEIGMGTTKANSGIVHAGYDCKPGTLKAKLNVRGNELYDELAENLNIHFRRNGSLVLAFSEEELAELEKLKIQGEVSGVKGLCLLSKSEVLMMEPHINPEVMAALYAPTAGIVFGSELAYALAEQAYANGVAFALNTEVCAIKRIADYYEVKTNKETYLAKTIVNAAGLYSDDVNNWVNAQKYRLKPRKGEYFLLDKGAKSIVDKTLFQLPTEKGKGILVLPTVHDNVLIGPSAEYTDVKADLSTNQDTLLKNIEIASRSIPNLPMHLTITTFTGLRASVEDHYDFIIEEVGAGFINAIGIDSPGLTAAPAIGEYIRDLIIAYLQPVENPDFIKTREIIPPFHELPLDKQKELLAINPTYGTVICRCEKITEADIVQSIHRPLGATTLDGIKFRTRAGMGRCQAGFCTTKLIEILARETGIRPCEVTKCGGDSVLLIEEKGGLT